MFGEGWLLGGTRLLNVLSQEVTSLGSRLERELVTATGQVGWEETGWEGAREQFVTVTGFGQIKPGHQYKDVTSQKLAM